MLHHSTSARPLAWFPIVSCCKWDMDWKGRLWIVWEKSIWATSLKGVISSIKSNLWLITHGVPRVSIWLMSSRLGRIGLGGTEGGVRSQRYTNTSCNLRKAEWVLRSEISMWGWSNTWTGCMERLWSGQPTLSWPCFVQGFGLEGLQRPLPKEIMLWFSTSIRGRCGVWASLGSSVANTCTKSRFSSLFRLYLLCALLLVSGMLTGSLVEFCFLMLPQKCLFL